MDPQRARRVAAFGAPEGYPVILRGLAEDHTPVEQTVTVRSVAAGLAASTQWEALKARFGQEATYVISNTGDQGYKLAEEDSQLELNSDTRPHSFPAMLLVLLHHRWRQGGTPVTILPCELVRRNGEVLRGIIGDLARQAGAEPALLDWLLEDCLWINTLVDRIVSEPIEPVGAIAEPYALWAVERQKGLAMPFTHPDVVLTDDLEPYERLKLHILNLGHTWMAQRWLDAGSPAGLTVREVMQDPQALAALKALYAQEVVPGFAAQGLGDQAAAYIDTTLARFANPTLDHRLADIASGHAAKLEKRVAGFIDWVGERDPALALPRLRHLSGENISA
jgi:tagaturonate reductase